MLTILLAVKSGVPRIYGGRVFSHPDVLRVNVQEMGGFLSILPPRVALLAVSGPPPPKLLLHKSGAIKIGNCLPLCDVSATSPP